MIQKIAVAYEEHPEAARAFDHALWLAQRLQLPLEVFIVEEPLPAYTAYTAAVGPGISQMLQQDKDAYYEKVAANLASEGKAVGVQISHSILANSSVNEVVDSVQRAGIDLLIVGLHRRALRISSLWSTVYSLSQSLSCSILGVH